METKPPLPPFTLETAAQKVQAAEDAWVYIQYLCSPFLP